VESNIDTPAALFDERVANGRRDLRRLALAQIGVATARRSGE